MQGDFINFVIILIVLFSSHHVECHLLQNESPVLVLILHSQNIPATSFNLYHIHHHHNHDHHHHHHNHDHHHHHYHHHHNHLHFNKVGKSKLCKRKEDEDKTADDVNVQSCPIRDLRKYNVP